MGYGLGNFIKLAHYGHGLATYLLNSTVIAAITVAGTLAVSTLGGDAFARFRFPGRDLLFLAILAILMVPYPTLLIPLYVLPVAVVNMQQNVFGSIDCALLEAGVVVLALPCIVLFLILQRGYVRGFMSGSLRG